MGAPAAVAAEDTRQVMSELNRVRDAIGTNRQVISDLEQRLSDVLMDEPQKEGATPDAPEDALCPLAGMLRSVRRDIRDCNDQVRSILRKLEL